MVTDGGQQYETEKKTFKYKLSNAKKSHPTSI